MSCNGDLSHSGQIGMTHKLGEELDVRFKQSDSYTWS